MTSTTDTLKERIETLTREAQLAIARAANPVEVEQLRVHYLGKKGVLTEQLKSLGGLPPHERPPVGEDPA